MTYNIILGRNESDRKHFGLNGTIFIGKGYVKMGQTTSLSNNILLDVARSHVILVSGKRGSGKSHSLSVIAEEIARLPVDIAKNLSVIMFDTMGVFWTMKYPNLRDEVLLEEWGLKPEGMNIELYVPYGYFHEFKKKGLLVDHPFAIKTSELHASEWCDIFGVSLLTPIGVLIERTLEELGKAYGDDYDIEDFELIIEKNKKAKRGVKDATVNLFKNVQSWGLLSNKGTTIDKLIQRGKIIVIDLSAYSDVSGNWNIKNLVVGLLGRKLLAERIKSRKFEELESIESQEIIFLDDKRELEKPLVWLFIDEAHQFLHKIQKTLASEALIQLLREGRQPGISLALATQQPGEISKEVLTQSDIVISHRLTAKVDLDALNMMMQSYLLSDIQTLMNNLPRLAGSAIILDDNSERIYPIQIRPKLSWHGGEAPSAVKYSKKEEIEKELNFEL